MTVELYPHQEKAVEKLSNGKILCGDMGSGKSLTAIAYFFSKVCGGVYGDAGSVRRPMPLYVITTAKKRDSLDWEKEAAKFGIGREIDGSIPGMTITVDSWNNIEKYEEETDGFFIFDEQRVVGSGAWTKSFYKIAKRNQWILLSATPGDTWLDYIPVFIANGFYKNRTEFKREHTVYSYYGKFPKLERYLGVGTLIRLRNQILVDMPFERHTTRHSETIFVDHDVDLLNRVVKDRWHVYEDRPIRDVAELFLVMRKVVNSHSSRLEFIRTIMSTHPKVIVFYNFDYELEILRELGGVDTTSSLSKTISGPTTTTPTLTKQSEQTPSLEDGNTSIGILNGEIPFAIAEWNGHKHEEIPKTDSWVYLVQYQAGAEGWNCVDTNAVIFYSLTYSYKNYYQAHGRIDRLNTPFEDLYYYNLRSKALIDKLVWKSLQAKKSFNESKMSDLF